MWLAACKLTKIVHVDPNKFLRRLLVSSVSSASNSYWGPSLDILVLYTMIRFPTHLTSSAEQGRLQGILQWPHGVKQPTSRSSYHEKHFLENYEPTVIFFDLRAPPGRATRKCRLVAEPSNRSLSKIYCFGEKFQFANCNFKRCNICVLNSAGWSSNNHCNEHNRLGSLTWPFNLIHANYCVWSVHEMLHHSSLCMPYKSVLHHPIAMKDAFTVVDGQPLELGSTQP